ncbi:MAG: hypothetical protein ACK55I_30850, partial [bacterium]
MEEAIIRENTTRFSLAYSSPIFEKDIIEKIGSIAQTDEVKDLIYNNVYIETTNVHINLFLPLLYQLNYKTVPIDISLERWNNHWRSSREKMASLFSGLHFGHYKAQTSSILLSQVKNDLVN